MTRVSVLSLSLWLSASLLAACSPPGSVPAPRSHHELASSASVPALSASTPAPPTSAYRSISRGSQLLWLATALAPEPPDYDRLASLDQNDYRAIYRTGARAEQLQALQPALAEKLATVRAHPWIYINREEALQHYDPVRHSFRFASTLFRPGADVVFMDAYEVRLVLRNGADFSELKVADPALARQIEALAGVDRHVQLRLYLLAQAGQTRPQAQVQSSIMQLQLLGPDHQVILSQSAPH